MGSRPALAYGRPLDDAPVTPPPAPSSLLPSAGLAMLRADESPGYWRGKGLACFFIMGENEFRSHRHCDDYQIVLHGKGRLLYPDINVWNYEDDKAVGWTHRSIAHNTLVVDGASNVPAPYAQRHDFSPEVKFVAAPGQPFEKQGGIGSSNAVGPQSWPKKVVLSRALFLAKEYLVDFFWAASPTEHVYDWACTDSAVCIRPAKIPAEPGPDAVQMDQGRLQSDDRRAVVGRVGAAGRRRA